MAELNFGLLTPPGSQSIGNAFVQGMDQAAVARAQENQNALSQYTLGKAKREDELTNKMLAGMQSATTLEQQAAVLRSVGRYKDASDLINSDLQRRYRLGQIEAQPGALLKNKADTAILHGNIMEREANAVVANPTSARAMQAIVNFGKATGQDVTQELKTLTELGDDPNKIAAWARGHALKGKDLAAFSTPKPTPTNVGNKIVFLDMNPNSPTFKSEVIPSQNIGVSPNTIEQINATRKNHLETLAQQGWIFDTDRGLAVNPRLGISQSISTLMASVEPQGSAGGVAPAAPAAIPTAPSAAPAGTPPLQLNVTPGIAPSSASNVPIPQSIVRAIVPPALQNVRDNDRLAILLKERENQVFLGRVDPALDREIANLQGKPTNVASQTTTQPAQRTVLGPKPADLQKTEIELNKQYVSESKGFIETKIAIDKAKAALKDAATNPTAGLSAGTAFMKILDPQSVVRETELAMALKSSGWFDRATNVANTLQAGRTILTPTQITNLNKTIDGLFEEVKAEQRIVDAGYTTRAKSYGLDIKNIITDRGQNKKAADTIIPKNAPPIESFRRR